MLVVALAGVTILGSTVGLAGIREVAKRNPITQKVFRGIAMLGAVALLHAPAALVKAYADETQPTSTFTLQLLHASDMEGGIEAIDNAPQFSALLNVFKAEFGDTVIISAGDNYIKGPFYAAGNDPRLRMALGREGSGRADIMLLNAMGFMASALGNHEFDEGTAVLASLINTDREYIGTAFPFLSANLDFSRDRHLAPLVVLPAQEASSVPNSISKSTVITTPSGEKIGVIGVTTPYLASISEAGGVDVAPTNSQDIATLAAIIHASAAELTAKGIDKIILTSHLQKFNIEEELASYLRDVDIIIAGGSNNILADANDRLWAGDVAARPYPILTQSAANKPLAIVSTDGNYRYVGRLVVDFDAMGNLLPASIDPMVSGVYAADMDSVVDTGNADPDSRVVVIADLIKEVVHEKDGNIFGATSVYLNGNRNAVRSEETNLGNLIADSMLTAAQRIDSSVVAALVNGGGIRASVGVVVGNENFPPPANVIVNKTAGQISQLDIENTLRFNNALSLLTLSAIELLEVVEHTVADAGDGLTTGSFPQIAGLAFSFDASLPAGNRVQSLVTTDAQGIPSDIVVRDGEVRGDAQRTFRIVTVDYLADGGSGHPYPNFPHTNRVDLLNVMTEEQSGELADFSSPGSSQDALAEYLARVYSTSPFVQEDVSPDKDYRIQNLAYRHDDLDVARHWHDDVRMPSDHTFSMQLGRGLNMISLPLMPRIPYTARSFMEKIGATTVIIYDTAAGAFIGYTAASAGNGFVIEGGQGYIVNVTNPSVVHFSGKAWDNRAIPSAPTVASASQTWAFVLRAQLDGIENVNLTVSNGGHEVAIAQAANDYHATWADLNQRPVVAVGDILTVAVHDAKGDLLRTLRYEVTAADVQRGFAQLRITAADLIPRRTVLLPNYPNPFNPETWLPYQLSTDAEVSIHIYTVSGQLVRQLNLGHLQAGYYLDKSRAAYWDGRNDRGEQLAAGVYFYQLNTPTSSTSRKMVILK